MSEYSESNRYKSDRETRRSLEYQEIGIGARRLIDALGGERELERIEYKRPWPSQHRMLLLTCKRGELASMQNAFKGLSKDKRDIKSYGADLFPEFPLVSIRNLNCNIPVDFESKDSQSQFPDTRPQALHHDRFDELVLSLSHPSLEQGKEVRGNATDFEIAEQLAADISDFFKDWVNSGEGYYSDDVKLRILDAKVRDVLEGRKPKIYNRTFENLPSDPDGYFDKLAWVGNTQLTKEELNLYYYLTVSIDGEFNEGFDLVASQFKDRFREHIYEHKWSEDELLLGDNLTLSHSRGGRVKTDENIGKETVLNRFWPYEIRKMINYKKK